MVSLLRGTDEIERSAGPRLDSLAQACAPLKHWIYTSLRGFARIDKGAATARESVAAVETTGHAMFDMDGAVAG
ncbi:MAG: hypothetical protein IVW56_09275 [Candidatus Binataceae bacterium]|nr:hypothetical protein [Candidatus Binataceae bacterium]